MDERVNLQPTFLDRLCAFGTGTNMLRRGNGENIHDLGEEIIFIATEALNSAKFMIS